MTTSAIVFMVTVHCIIYTGIFVGLRKIMSEKR